MQVFDAVSIVLICCHEGIANPNISYRPIETITTLAKTKQFTYIIIFGSIYYQFA